MRDIISKKKSDERYDACVTCYSLISSIQIIPSDFESSVLLMLFYEHSFLLTHCVPLPYLVFALLMYAQYLYA